MSLSTDCLMGLAVGDSMGLPFEGLAPSRVARRLKTNLAQSLVAGRGMVSDDTEHACLTAQALIRAGDDVEAFRRHLARGLRWWLIRLPVATGLATARSILRLWIGFSPLRSGVASAGNGAAMRAPILGLIADGALRREFVRASTRITHADVRAEQGSQIIALAASISASQAKRAAQQNLR